MAVTQIIDNGTITGSVTETNDMGDFSPVDTPFDVTLIKYIGSGGDIKTPNKQPNT